MTLVFEDAVKPPIVRQNEFRDVVDYLAKNPTAVKSYTIALATLKDSEEKAAADKRKMAEAGNEQTPPVTVRTRPEKLEDGKSIKVFIWAVKKIERKPKSKPVETTPVTPEKGKK